MAEWPEFYFDSEFESASEISSLPRPSLIPPVPAPRSRNATAQSQVVQPANKRRSLRVVQAAESVRPNQCQNNQPLKIGVKRQLQTLKRQPQWQQQFQKWPPAARKWPRTVARKQPLKSWPLKVGIQVQPPDGIQIQPSFAIQSKPESQPPFADKRQPPFVDKNQPPFAEKGQPLITDQPSVDNSPEQSQPHNNEQKQPLKLKSQPQNGRPRGRPPDVLCKFQPQKGHQSRVVQPPEPDPIIPTVKLKTKQAPYRPMPAPDLPPDPDPKSSVSKEDWGKGSIDPG